MEGCTPSLTDRMTPYSAVFLYSSASMVLIWLRHRVQVEGKDGEEKILETLAKRDEVRQLDAMFQGVLIQIPYF